MPPKPRGRTSLQAAKEEARRALERRTNDRTSTMKESPSPRKATGKSPAKRSSPAQGGGGGGGGARPPTRSSSSASSSRSTRKTEAMEVSEEEEEEEDESGEEMEVEEEEEDEEPPAPPRRTSTGAASKKRAPPSSSSNASVAAKKSRQARREEEEEEGRGTPPLLMAKPRDVGVSPYNDDGYVDDRFYNAPAPAAGGGGGEGGGSEPPSSFLSSFAFWRREASEAPSSPSRHVVFRDNVEEIPEEDVPLGPPPKSPGPPPVSALRQRPAAAQQQKRRSSLSQPSSSPGPSKSRKTGVDEEEEEEEEVAAAQPRRGILRKSTGGGGGAKNKTPVEVEKGGGVGLLDILHRLKMIIAYLVSAILVFIIVYGGCRMLLREKCPRGQTREQFFGLFGNCVVSSATIRQLMKAVQKETVNEICHTPWALSGGETKGGKAAVAGVGGFSITERLDKPPSFGFLDVWKDIKTDTYPWTELEARGIVGRDTRVWLKGRKEVLQALWSCWAFRCRLRIWFAERFYDIILAVVLCLLLAYFFMNHKAKARERKQVESIKREVIELLIDEGEMPPEHARDDLLYRLKQDYAHLGLSEKQIKKLWPKVMKAVEKESRVAKSNIERYGRAQVHWRWTGSRRSSLNGTPRKQHHTTAGGDEIIRARLV